MRYGSARYGSGKYGASPATDNILWAFEVDWLNIGYSGDNEASRAIACHIERGRDYLLNADGDGFQRVQPGRLTMTVNNHDGRYDPYNTGSPLYPYVTPGCKFRLRMKNGSAGSWQNVMAGYIEDIRPSSGRMEALITGVDAYQLLSQQEVSTALVEENITVADAITAVLDAAGWTEYTIDNMTDSIRYWWLDQVKVTDAIGQLEDASLGTFFIAADGSAKYYSRRRNVAQVLALTNADLLRDIEIAQPWDTVRNSIDLMVNPMVEQASGVIWTLGDIPSVAVGATIELWAQYQYNGQSCPAVDVLDPVVTTDYLMNTASGGGGTDLTTDFAVVMTPFAESALLVITNNSASIGYITLMQVKGSAVTLADPLRVSDSDPASIAMYGLRKFAMDSPWLQNSNNAVSLAAVLVDLLANPRKNPTIRMDGRPDIQFSVDLFDRIGLQVPIMFIDGAYRIGSITHEWLSDTGQRTLTTLKLEPVIDTTGDYWIFPVLIGNTDITAGGVTILGF